MLEIMLGIGFVVVPAIVFTFIGMAYSTYKQYQEDKEKKFSTLQPLGNEDYKGYTITWENGIFHATDGEGVIMGQSIKDLVDQIDENEQQ